MKCNQGVCTHKMPWNIIGETGVMVKNIRKVIVFLCLSLIVCSGCAWPGFMTPKGTATVVTDLTFTPTTQKNAFAYIPRMVVVQYWRNESINEIPSSIELIKAFAVDVGTFPVEFPSKMYTVIWTPALGAQHLHPEPEIMVFASGYWPVDCYGDDGIKFGGAPPREDPYQYRVLLQPDLGIPPQRCPLNKKDITNFPPFFFHMDSLDMVLALGKGITNADRLMVYRQMRKQAIVWREQLNKREIVTDGKELQRAIDALDKRIEKFKGRRRRNKEMK